MVQLDKPVYQDLWTSLSLLSLVKKDKGGGGRGNQEGGAVNRMWSEQVKKKHSQYLKKIAPFCGFNCS